MILDTHLYDSTSFGSAKKISCRCDACGKEKLVAKQKLFARGGYKNCQICTVTKDGMSRSPVETTCAGCGKVELRRKDSLVYWAGNCQSCSSRETSNRPDVKAKASKRAREQVIRQGGVPNAKTFTSDRVRGAANHKWRGGITPEYMKIRNSKETQRWRREVFTRDGFTCTVCEQRGGNLHADHILSFALHPELRFDLDNGRTLCVTCHRAFGAKVSAGVVLKPSISPFPRNWKVG